MKLYADRNKSESHIYFYFPSESARSFLFYPIAAGVYVRNRGYRISRECYNSFLLIYVIEGSMQLDQDGRHYEAKAGDLLIIDCYREHLYYTDTLTKFIWLHFDGSTTRPWFDSLYSEFSSAIKANPGCQEQMLSILSGVKNSENEHILSKKIHSLMCDIFSFAKMQISSKSSSIISDAKLYIEEHLAEDLTVKTIADVFHYSPAYFSKIFKDSTKLSPYEYILSRRIELAKRLLLQTNLPMDVVADKSGFHSVSRFICAFKQATNFTPLKFRKLHF